MKPNIFYLYMFMQRTVPKSLGVIIGIDKTLPLREPLSEGEFLCDKYATYLSNGYFSIHMDKKLSSIREYDVIVPYLGNYGAGFHIREIARKMSMNHRTALLALNSLEKRGIVKHQTSGRNKVFYLNKENPRTKDHVRDVESYRLGHTLNENPTIKELYSSLLSPPISETPIVLFGSYAKGEQDKKSDIDLLLIEKNGKILDAIKKFEFKYDINVHVQIISQDKLERGFREKEPLLFEIASEHIILNNQDAFVNILWRHFCE